MIPDRTRLYCAAVVALAAVPGCFLGGSYVTRGDEATDSGTTAVGSTLDDRTPTGQTRPTPSDAGETANGGQTVDTGRSSNAGQSSSSGQPSDTEQTVDAGQTVAVSDSSASGTQTGTTSSTVVVPSAPANASLIYSGGSGPPCSSALEAPYIGEWEQFSDSPGQSRPAQGGVPGVQGAADCAMELQSDRASGWGGGGGFSLNSRNGSWDLYDASRYTGLRLWVKGFSTGGTTLGGQAADDTLVVEVKTTRDDTLSDHGFACPLSAEWTLCEANFTELPLLEEDAPWRRLDLTQLRGFGFVVDRASSQSSVTFDIWIDDVAFFQ